MDKSDTNPRTYISLLDSADDIRSKVMKAKTDARGDFDISDPDEGITNLVTIMSVLTGRPAESPDPRALSQCPALRRRH